MKMDDQKDGRNIAGSWQRIGHGDQQAHTVIYDFYCERLRAFVWHKITDKDRKQRYDQDLAHDVFTKIWADQSNPTHQGERTRDEIWKFLLLCANGIVIDRRRHENCKGLPTQSISIQGCDESVFALTSRDDRDIECEDELNAFLNSLPNDNLRDVCDKLAHDVPKNKIADLIGKTSRTVCRKLDLIRGYWNKFASRK